MVIILPEKKHMTKLLTTFLILACIATQAQTREEIVLARAKEFYRVVCQNGSETHRIFVEKNYSKALQDRQMKQKVASPDGSTSESQDKEAGVESKVKMFGRLHEDFGTGKLKSITPIGEDVEIVATTGDGMQGKFRLKFTKDAPYLIDGLAIEVGD